MTAALIAFSKVCLFDSNAYKQEFPATFQGNSSVFEIFEQRPTTPILCWVGAFFMILSFCFAWLRSPRSGRVSLALGIVGLMVAQGVLFFFLDPLNSQM